MKIKLLASGKLETPFWRWLQDNEEIGVCATELGRFQGHDATGPMTIHQGYIIHAYLLREEWHNYISFENLLKIYISDFQNLSSDRTRSGPDRTASFGARRQILQ